MVTVKLMLFVKTPLVPVMVKVLLGVDEQMETDTPIMIIWPWVTLKEVWE